MFEVEGDGENPVVHHLEHASVKLGSESIVIDGFDAEPDEYTLKENGTLTFTDVDVFGEVEISYETGYRSVLQTHPHRDVLLAKHPVDRFGLYAVPRRTRTGTHSKSCPRLNPRGVLAHPCTRNG